MTTVLGIDVSKHQGTINWSKVPNNADVKFCYSRASLGKSDRDPKFKRNWQGSGEAGLLRGAYHAFWPGRPAREQSDNFFGAYTPQPGDLVPMLDVEVYHKTIPVNDFLKEVKKLLSMMADRAGKPPFLYTANWFWETLGNPAAIDAYPLWVAYYNPDPRPVLPHGWSSYQIWQYTDKGRVPGVTENTCDMDRFAGTMAELNAFRI